MANRRNRRNNNNPKSLFEVLGLDKSNDPNYKLNPDFNTVGRAGRSGPKYIPKTQEEIAAESIAKDSAISNQVSFMQPDMPIDLQGKTANEYIANYEKFKSGGLNYNAMDSILNGGQITGQNINNPNSGYDQLRMGLDLNKDKNKKKDDPYKDDRTKIGNFFAQIGGRDYLPPEELAAMTPEERAASLKKRDSAKYKGIVEALAMADDRFSGRNVQEGIQTRITNELAREKAEAERNDRANSIRAGQELFLTDPRFKELRERSPNLLKNSDFMAGLSSEYGVIDTKARQDQIVAAAQPIINNLKANDLPLDYGGYKIQDLYSDLITKQGIKPQEAFDVIKQQTGYDIFSDENLQKLNLSKADKQLLSLTGGLSVSEQVAAGIDL
tara:strand:+ start:3809 stop:4960 length:1152 start_codon:yes stop_codon:yes gene_type:complete